MSTGIPRLRRLGLTPFILAVLLAGLWCAPVFSAGLPPGAAAAGAASEPSTSPPELPATLTKPEVRDLMSRLSDEEVRAILIQQLDKTAEAQAEASQQDTLQDSVEAMLPEARERLKAMVASYPRLLDVGDNVVTTVSRGVGADRFFLILAYAIGIFAAAGLAEWAFRRLFTQFGGRGADDDQLSVVDRLCILFLRLCRDLLSLAVFGAVVVGLFFALQKGSEPVRVLMSSLFWGVITFRLISILLRFMFAPYVPWLRIPALSDAASLAIYGRVRFAVLVVVIAWYTGPILTISVVDPPTRALLSIITIILVVLLLIAVVWRDRREVGEAILGQLDPMDTGSRVRVLVATNWHIFMSAVLALIGIMAIGTFILTGERIGTTIVTTLVVILLLPVVDWLLRAAVCRVLGIPGLVAGADVEPKPASAPEAPALLAEGGPESTADDGLNAVAETADGAISISAGSDPVSEAAELAAAERRLAQRRAYRDVLVKNLRIVLAVLVVGGLADIWNLNLQDAAASKVGATLAGSIFDIIITLILASAAWGILRVAIRSAVPDAEGDGEEVEAGEIGGKGKSRLETLLPLFGKFMMVTIVVMVALIILSEMGVDIGPLIAGAGVIGLAVGFGAQTLVRDIISGLFFLVDDAFRVGEYVDIGSVRGMVEHISIRSIRLRHHNGPLHTVPFGEIQHLTNFSRDWAIMKLEVRVPFDTDLEKVRKLIKKTGQELMNDPNHGPNFLQPLKSQGVHRMDDSAFIVRVKFMAKPGEQFVLRREVFRRIQEAFAANGIRFAPRRVIVDTGGESVTPALAAAAAAAGADSVDRSDKAPDDGGEGL